MLSDTPIHIKRDWRSEKLISHCYVKAESCNKEVICTLWDKYSWSIYILNTVNKDKRIRFKLNTNNLVLLCVYQCVCTILLYRATLYTVMQWIIKLFTPRSLSVSFHQRGCGQDRMLHRDRCHAGAHEAREVRRHLRPRDVHARPEELHGPDRGPVHLHSRSPAGGRHVRQHRGAGAQPVRPHPETHPAPARRDGYCHGAGIQGERARQMSHTEDFLID